MMDFANIPTDKKLYLFEVDDVLFPKKDYLLQIYYLFSQFVEFTEGRPIATEMVNFMKETYMESAEENLYNLTAKKFNFKNDYKENFERLMVNGHLPLKLFLFNKTKLLFASILEKGGQIGILTKGNPALQLNKVKHIDWQGFDRNVKIYFIDELNFRNIDPFTYIASENQVQKSDLFFIEDNIAKL
ncbi:HAD family hydrolase [Sphingobacterium cellulitidis]|uniref:HAD family hydrolase n=1 Tax=Sphingobacterium cellulitidis TaxID=1768011 RepID=UPI00370DBBB1